MALLVKRQPDARLLLVGGGPCEAALRERAAASPAAAAIRFMGRVPHHEVDRYYALADIMAYPRKHSRLTDLVTPLKPLEAMAQGKLVAASDVGGHRELITHGSTGALFAPDDPAACADALAVLLNRRDLWPGYRKAGYEHVRKRHDWAVNAGRYRDVYQMVSPVTAGNGPGATA
jgi:glycosyltransferase involved in cell wall biosynthesis